MSKPKDLDSQLEEKFSELDRFGYGSIDVPGLLFATHYRLACLCSQAIFAEEMKDGRLTPLSEAEQAVVTERVTRDNPRFSGPMLAETLRYQLGYTYKRVPEFDAHPMPDQGTETYIDLVDTLGQLGTLLGLLQSEIGDEPLAKHLPAKLRRR